MNGDPSPPALAAIYAFGGRAFDVKAAYASLKRAATVPTAKDLSRTGCPVLCVGQRPGLDQWLKLHYMPVRSEEHTSELQSLMRISYAVFCLKKKNNTQKIYTNY